MSIDKVVTFLILIFGLLLLFVIIPQQIEAVDYGYIFPKTVPQIAAYIFILCAVIQLFADKSNTRLNVLVVARTFIFLGFIVVGVYLMPQFGFEFVAPVIAFLVMMLIRERRWYWYLTGCLVIPIGVWLLVEQILGRTLP